MVRSNARSAFQQPDFTFTFTPPLAASDFETAKARQTPSARYNPMTQPYILFLIFSTQYFLQYFNATVTSVFFRPLQALSQSQPLSLVIAIIMWILKLVTSLWAVTSSLSYYIIDPAASAALVQSGCRLPSFGCLRLAQEAHIKLVKGQIEKYWCQVAEDMAQREREKKAKEDHDTYIAGQIAKGDKWDRWEVSPPTVNVFNSYNYINPTFNFNTIISTCPATPDIPGVDVAALVKKHQPTIGDELVIDKYAVYKEAGMVWLGHVLDTFLFSVLIYIVCSIVVKLIKFIFRFLFM